VFGANPLNWRGFMPRWRSSSTSTAPSSLVYPSPPASPGEGGEPAAFSFLLVSLELGSRENENIAMVAVLRSRRASEALLRSMGNETEQKKQKKRRPAVQVSGAGSPSDRDDTL